MFSKVGSTPSTVAPFSASEFWSRNEYPKIPTAAGLA